MAFSSKFAKAKVEPAPAPVATGDAEDSDEVESVHEGEDKDRAAEQERLRKVKEADDEARAKAIAEARANAEQREKERKAAEEQRRKQAAASEEERRRESRRKAEEQEERRLEYEQEKARQTTINRSKQQAAKMFGGQGAFGSGGGGGNFAWKKSAPQAAGAARSAGRSDPKFRDVPSHDECEMAISAMISRTSAGMKEGLSNLGLPSYPLSFIPGQELKLMGRNVREEVNEMIHAWMTDEKDEFYSVLARVKEIVDKPVLTEEEMEMVTGQEGWEKVMGPDGKPMYTKRDTAAPKTQQPVVDDDDDDDEVIDVVAGNPVKPVRAAPTPAASSQAARASAASNQEDYYGLLGVSPGSTLHDIRTKFRALVITEHPEKGGDPKKFAKLNKAYSVLSDQKKRQEYDDSRAAGGGEVPRQKQFLE